MDYEATEQDDAALCAIWWEDESLDPREVTHVFARFANIYGHWPIVGRKVEGAA